MELRHAISLALPLFLTGSNVRMDCGHNLSGLEGWTIIKTGSIKGSFKGCENDRLVELLDGTILRCASYGYQYAYMPDVVVFGKAMAVGDKSVVMMKMMVEDEVYDMAPVIQKP